MLNFIDNFLNRITMYRLVLYVLFVYIFAAVILGYLGVIPYPARDILFTTLAFIVFCWIFNKVLSTIWKIPTNAESVYITACILALIITPTYWDGNIWFLVLISFVAMASKYLIAVKGKHIFNPAAFAVTISFFAIDQGASWWVGNVSLLPLVAIGGFLVVRKIQRFDFVWSFLGTAVVVLALSNFSNALLILDQFFIYSPTLFFATIMLTEPLTSPPTRTLRIIEGILIGLLFYPGLSFGNYYVLPEFALLVGNIFSFVVSPKGRYLLTFKSKQMIGTDTYDFQFDSNQKFEFHPGQYLEYTLGHKDPDLRGNRRFFTIASSPTEKEVHLGIKFYQNPSSFKTKLMSLHEGEKLLAGQLAGDFILPKNKDKKLAFIAGGIGITPFRSMAKYMVDQNEKRDVTLFYSCKTEAECAYKDVLEQARSAGLNTIYVITDEKGPLTTGQIRLNVPDFKERIFYLSGPRSMVKAFERTLKSMGVPSYQIKIDFFPGYA